jgi:3-deoxy-D-manno-octulosonate 8-phosphate phosphatase (KDO 8-P phosphatase)
VTTLCTEQISSEIEELIREIRVVVFDFDGVFTDNSVYVWEDGTEAVRCYRGDGLGLRKLERAGIVPVIISTETNPVVSMRCNKLRVRCVQGCEEKRSTLETILKEMGITPAQAAFVGNDINDLDCLSFVGLPIVVADAHPDVFDMAKCQTKIRGGHGAVREVCDLFDRVLFSGAGNREK